MAAEMVGSIVMLLCAVVSGVVGIFSMVGAEEGEWECFVAWLLGVLGTLSLLGLISGQ